MKSSWKPFCLLAILGILLAPFNAAAQNPGARDHDGGFFLRLALGAGGANSKNDGLPLEFSGAGGELDVAIGAVITPNLAIHGTIFGWLIQDPDVDDGMVSGTVSGDASMSAFGGGVTYYFMPINIYMSGSVGFGIFSASGDIDGESDTGFAGQLTAGKEWWVSNRWGLGVSGVYGFFSIAEPSTSENWTGWNLAVMFSATFN
jgi:hypothetical protein